MKLLQCPCCATEVEPQLVLTIWQLNDPSSTLHVMTANGSVEAPKPVYCWRVCKFDRRVHVLEEAEAARSISQRGVMLVATAHGTDLRSIMGNPDLNSLVGGMQTVILGDAAAGAAHGGAKTRTERRGEPTFRCLVEVQGRGMLRLRPDVAASVDALLGGDDARTGGGPGGGGRGSLPNAAVGSGGHRLVSPGSLLLCVNGGDSVGGGSGAAAVAEAAEAAGRQQEQRRVQEAERLLLPGGPPLEQLRWSRQKGAGAHASEPWTAGATDPGLCVRLLLPTADATWSAAH